MSHIPDADYLSFGQPALPAHITEDQYRLLVRMMKTRDFPFDWKNRVRRELSRFFQIEKLRFLPASRFFEAGYFILNYPKPKQPVPPRNALVNLFDATKGEESRWLVVKDVHGALHGKRLPANSFEFDPERLAEIIGEPAGLVRKALLPGILAAVAKRM